MLQRHAAAPEEHLERDEKLKQSYQQVHRDDVGRPEQEKGVAHVKNAIHMSVE